MKLIKDWCKFTQWALQQDDRNRRANNFYIICGEHRQRSYLDKPWCEPARHVRKTASNAARQIVRDACMHGRLLKIYRADLVGLKVEQVFEGIYHESCKKSTIK